MNIQDLVRQDYLRAVEVTERMAARFPQGSREQRRWLRVAAVYAQVTEALVAERAQPLAKAGTATDGPIAGAQVTLNPGPQPS
jgi:hypothetical protein